MQDLLRRLKKADGSDLFITAGFPPAIKVDGESKPVTEQPLTPQQSNTLVRAIMNDRQTKAFDESKECNFAIAPPNIGRFRVSAFVQQSNVGCVCRTINTEIPTIEELELPGILKDIVMTKRGLVILVGGTGTGKSTTLAAMVGHRNASSHGHIITIEDPIEYVHEHRGCVVTQREIGVDTEGWHVALKNTLRQAPDVILIGEIRTRETMDHAIAFAETGHLCLSTVHANTAPTTLDRIINMFPQAQQRQIFMDLSHYLNAIVAQRLVIGRDRKRVPAVEVLLNTPHVADLTMKGDVTGVKEALRESMEAGMQSFDASLYQLYKDGNIDLETALANADSATDLEAKINFG